jgi:hypothetical protein
MPTYGYNMHKNTFYEELPEVKIVSKVTLHDQVCFQIVTLKFLWCN